MITTGSIVKAPFSYIDNITISKVRYGLVISDENFHRVFGKRRYILAYITSVEHNRLIENWEFLIEEGTQIFKQSGLKKRSIVKAHRIALVQENLIIKELGKVPLFMVKEIKEKAIKKMFDL